MQVWDSVKVISGEFEGQAGSVQGFKFNKSKVDVKMDLDGEIRTFEVENLQRLG